MTRFLRAWRRLFWLLLAACLLALGATVAFLAQRTPAP